MKRFIPLLFLAVPAFAQEADPIQTFLNELSAEATAHQHMVATAPLMIQALQKKFADAEAQKQTLIEWLKEAQAKEAK